MIQVIRTLLPLVLVFGAFALAQAAEKGKGFGDGHDGNRASVTHLIDLFDDKGIRSSRLIQPRPISMRNTCGKCHDYDAIAAGWHFHSGSTNVLSGRVGEPWVLTDNRIRTQIPISNRGWKGTYKPGDVDMNAWKFLKKFSSHFPGGNYGEMAPSEDEEDEGMRRKSIHRSFFVGRFPENTKSTVLPAIMPIANKIRATPLFRQRRRTTDGLRRLPADWLQ